MNRTSAQSKSGRAAGRSRGLGQRQAAVGSLKGRDLGSAESHRADVCSRSWVCWIVETGGRPWVFHGVFPDRSSGLGGGKLGGGGEAIRDFPFYLSCSIISSSCGLHQGTHIQNVSVHHCFPGQASIYDYMDCCPQPSNSPLLLGWAPHSPFSMPHQRGTFNHERGHSQNPLKHCCLRRTEARGPYKGQQAAM